LCSGSFWAVAELTITKVSAAADKYVAVLGLNRVRVFIIVPFLSVGRSKHPGFALLPLKPPDNPTFARRINPARARILWSGRTLPLAGKPWYPKTVGFSVHRREWTMPLLGLAALACLVGAVAAWLSIGLQSWQEYFPDGPWRWTLYGCLAAAGCALLTTLAETLWSSGHAKSVVTYDGKTNASLRHTLEETAALVSSALAQKEPHVSLALDEILKGGMVLGASDIHLNPQPRGLGVTYRVDGVLYPLLEAGGPVAQRLVARVKVLAFLDHYAKGPQDGALRRQIGEAELEARVSTMPANHGHRVVLRLVRGNQPARNLDELGLGEQVEERFRRVLCMTQGIFYVSGPVGSGKTTTLYSALQRLHEERGDTTSLVSLEDPIEHQLPFATQTQIHPATGFGFAQALRSVLRQDPGALMLGEVRDKETAEIAMQAGLTGHLILTTIHVQSAPGTFGRLVDMGLEPVIVADSCAGASAQRLVRALCPDCRTPQAPDPVLEKRLRQIGAVVLDGDFYAPVGCPSCDQRGYSGRIPIAEILLMSGKLREAVVSRRSVEELRSIAISEGMVPLLESALQLARGGRTSLEEVLRVLT
jgi:general secretion pathway protein E